MYGINGVSAQTFFHELDRIPSVDKIKAEFNTRKNSSASGIFSIGHDISERLPDNIYIYSIGSIGIIFLPLFQTQ